MLAQTKSPESSTNLNRQPKKPGVVVKTLVASAALMLPVGVASAESSETPPPTAPTTSTTFPEKEVYPEPGSEFGFPEDSQDNAPDEPDYPNNPYQFYENDLAKTHQFDHEQDFELDPDDRASVEAFVAARFDEVDYRPNDEQGEITNIQMRGFASPEDESGETGPTNPSEQNEKLALDRAQIMKEAIQDEYEQRYGVALPDELFTIESTEEEISDLEMSNFDRMVSQYGYESTQQVIDLTNNGQLNSLPPELATFMNRHFVVSRKASFNFDYAGGEPLSVPPYYDNEEEPSPPPTTTPPTIPEPPSAN